MKNIKPVYLSLLSGLLLYASWPMSPLTFLVFTGFVPLLLMELQVKKRAHFFWLVYLALLVWNIGTTWWILNSTVIGGVLAIVLNPLLMSIPWIGFYNVKKRFGPVLGYVSLVLFWLSFEWIHLNWDLSWPWLTLGNVFATHPDWVQWYQYLGASGGGLWILLANLYFFFLLKKTGERKSIGLFLSGGVLLLLPLLVSLLIGVQVQADNKDSQYKAPNIVVVQPNVDPWDQKFVAGKEEGQVQELILLSKSKIDSSTVLVVWPETAVPVPVNEDSMENNYFLAPVWHFLKQYPHLNLLTGMEGFRFYDQAHKTEYSQPIPNTDKYYDDYNSAVLMDSNRFQAYHKSKFVPGAESLPFFLKFMASWFDKFGGSTGGYAGQDDRTVLTTFNHTYRIAPAVCYESIYGEFMSRYIQNGANLIAVITNDGWWLNTSGYKQHENYARLRALETRCWIARSANTGVSCFIDPAGRVYDPQPYNTVASIRLSVPVTSPGETFYVRYGDIISKLAMTFGILLVIWDLIVIIKSRLQRGQTH